mmetsp:Transcript_18569/g.28523  ORF Transcript_18569/g.28523 Transcript_18569/m.28523 type:complete len:126 (-) Transcript_18569:164-541(-)|eukprot:CAMPEP_0170488126 /NCGR_PEP_ID=MMETSP0208-20121228/6745_1 /TAXON_ID=197538 /ORGANISM="Strombidium inclinatum, Strain S3" /LENGTH=125 /DNA_ID=CAMNT_0010762595 /DNA_START=1869 /DNA_END=2246 /DNA_ORIENTATION=-
MGQTFSIQAGSMAEDNRISNFDDSDILSKDIHNAVSPLARLHVHTAIGESPETKLMEQELTLTEERSRTKQVDNDYMQMTIRRRMRSKHNDGAVKIPILPMKDLNVKMIKIPDVFLKGRATAMKE